MSVEKYRDNAFSYEKYCTTQFSSREREGQRRLRDWTKACMTEASIRSKRPKDSSSIHSKGATCQGLTPRNSSSLSPLCGSPEEASRAALSAQHISACLTTKGTTGVETMCELKLEARAKTLLLALRRGSDVESATNAFFVPPSLLMLPARTTKMTTSKSTTNKMTRNSMP